MAFQPGALQQFWDDDDFQVQEEESRQQAESLLDSGSGNFQTSFFPIPVPFNNTRNSVQLIPRVPIRQSPSLQSESGKGGGPDAFLFAGKGQGKGTKSAIQQTGPQSDQGNLQSPEKLDPRLARASEMVQLVLNGLIQSGGIFKGTDGIYQINFSPRQITGPEAFNGELYFDITTSKLSYKNNGGAITTYG